MVSYTRRKRHLQKVHVVSLCLCIWKLIPSLNFGAYRNFFISLHMHLVTSFFLGHLISWTLFSINISLDFIYINFDKTLASAHKIFIVHLHTHEGDCLQVLTDKEEVFSLSTNIFLNGDLTFL
jgi:hypothetical protein